MGGIGNGDASVGAPVAIRVATADDAQAIAGIYRPYVQETAVTFECTAPGEDEMRLRIGRTLERYPYFVAERAGAAVGFTYAGPLRMRRAYEWSCETTIYVAADARGAGIGAALYGALEDALGKMGVLSLYACVAFPDSEDEHLTEASLRFHERMGYRKVGEMRHCGSKFGRWYSIAWMQKDIGPHGPDPQPISAFRP